MRRKDKELTDARLIENILEEAEVIRLAMVDEGEPYLVAMNFAYADGAIFLHSALEGRKVDILKKNDRVAFQTETDMKILLEPEACNCTTQYKSVSGSGRAVLVSEKQEKIKALDAIMKKYSGRTGFEYPDAALNKTLIIRVDIDRMTGKKSPA